MNGIAGVHHLNCAHVIRMHLGGKPLACHVMLLETASDGLVLVDSGLGTADYTQIASRLGWAFAYGYAKPMIDPSLAAINQVRQLGFDPQDVNQRPDRGSHPVVRNPAAARLVRATRRAARPHGRTRSGGVYRRAGIGR